MYSPLYITLAETHAAYRRTVNYLSDTTEHSQPGRECDVTDIENDSF